MGDFDDFLDNDSGLPADLESIEAMSSKGPVSPSQTSFTPKKLQAAIMDVLQQLGGTEWLLNQARDNPKEFFSLLKMCMPKEVDLAGTDAKFILNILQAIPDPNFVPAKPIELMALHGDNIDPDTPEGKQILGSGPQVRIM